MVSKISEELKEKKVYLDKSERLKSILENNEAEFERLKDYRIKAGGSLYTAINENIFKADVLGDKFSHLNEIQKGRLMTSLLNEIQSEVQTSTKDTVYGYGRTQNINRMDIGQNPNLLRIIQKAENILDNPSNLNNATIKPEGAYAAAKIPGTVGLDKILDNYENTDGNTQRAYRKFVMDRDRELQNANKGKTAIVNGQSVSAHTITSQTTPRFNLDNTSSSSAVTAPIEK